MRRRNAVLTTASTLVVLAAAVAPVQAQNVGFRYRVTPQPGQAAAFEAALKEHMAFRMANGETWTWATFQVVAGATLGSYLVVSNGHTYADMDSYQALHYGPFSMHFAATVAPLVESIGLRFNITDPEIGNPMPEGSQVSLLPVSRYYITPGQGQAFDAALAGFHEAIIANSYPVYFAVNRPTMGGPGGTVNIVGLSANWAGMDEQDPTLIEMMVSHYGEERANEIFQAFVGSYSRSEEYLLRARPDLSTN